MMVSNKGFIYSALKLLKVTSFLIAISRVNEASSLVMSKSYDLVVVGGGSAGLTAAKFASTFGKSVAIVEKSRLGGDCTWTGCVPSKSLLASAKSAHAVLKASKFGVKIEGKVSVDMKAVRERVRKNIDKIYNEDDSPEALSKLGIDHISGKANFEDTKTLLVSMEDDNDQAVMKVHANYGILIATGARPKNPENRIEGLDSIKYITYEEAFDLDDLPESITIVGGGPIGCELAQAFSRLGAAVTVIATKLLPREEPEVGETLQRVFVNEGIKVINSVATCVKSSTNNNHAHSVTCGNGETVAGDLMLVAVGREPVVKGMGLEELGVKINEAGGIDVDKNLMTSVKGLYAAGDCTGAQQFTHYAGYQGAVGARNILLPLTDPGILSEVPATTFTDPEIASVGMSEKAAKEEFGEDAIAVAFKYVKETDRAICEDVQEGLIKIIYKKKDYKILGATIMSPVAGEMIAEISTAMKTKLSFDMLATVMHTYPSHSFALQAMAAEVYYDKLVKSKRILNFLKRIGL